MSLAFSGTDTQVLLGNAPSLLFVSWYSIVDSIHPLDFVCFKAPKIACLVAKTSAKNHYSNSPLLETHCSLRRKGSLTSIFLLDSPQFFCILFFRINWIQVYKVVRLEAFWSFVPEDKMNMSVANLALQSFAISWKHLPRRLILSPGLACCFIGLFLHWAIFTESSSRISLHKLRSVHVTCHFWKWITSVVLISNNQKYSKRRVSKSDELKRQIARKAKDKQPHGDTSGRCASEPNQEICLDVNLSQGTTLPHVHRLCAVVAEFGSKQNCEWWCHHRYIIISGIKNSGMTCS